MFVFYLKVENNLKKLKWRPYLDIIPFFLIKAAI